ncbi:hypothetical protein [Streptomyces angustmyceticus]
MAAALLFLAREGPSFVDGSELVVDGGLTAHRTSHLIRPFARSAPWHPYLRPPKPLSSPERSLSSPGPRAAWARRRWRF